MRKLTPLWSAMLIAMACSESQAMNLTEAIQSTLTNHPELRADINSRLTADEQAKMAKGGYLPTVDMLLGYGRENTDSPSTRIGGDHSETLNARNAELRLRRMLFDGFNTPNEVDRTEAVVNARAYQVLGTTESLALRTVQVYLDVLKRREMVALAENNLYTEQVNLADAEANFISVVGRIPDELEAPPSLRGEMPGNVLEARQRVVENNPYLKSAQADVQAAEKQYEIAKSPFYPRFDIELATMANDNISGEEGHSNKWRAAVVMNYNLFNGNRDKARLRATSHQINQAMDIRNNALRQLNENLSLAWNAMENARLQTPKAREYADYTSNVRQAYQQQFGLGQRTLLDLLDSENELFTANRRYTDVRYTEEYSMYRVVAAMGDLLRMKNVVAPTEATALTEVRSEAQLPDLR